MPEEEHVAKGLIEAGYLVTDQSELDAIEEWFDDLWNDKSRLISSDDLRRAHEARKLRVGKKGRATELIDLPLETIKKSNLGVLLYIGETYRWQDKEVDVRRNVHHCKRRLDLRYSKEREELSRQVRDCSVLTFDAELKRNPKYRIVRFPPQKQWPTISDGSSVVYCEHVTEKDVPGLPLAWKIGPKSKSALVSAIRKRKATLSERLDDGPKGGRFTSWEPLYRLLSEQA